LQLAWKEAVTISDKEGRRPLDAFVWCLNFERPVFGVSPLLEPSPPTRHECDDFKPGDWVQHIDRPEEPPQRVADPGGRWVYLEGSLERAVDGWKYRRVSAPSVRGHEA
jgi:hypothetical protein